MEAAENSRFGLANKGKIFSFGKKRRKKSANYL
jgi:hypothetical protein